MARKQTSLDAKHLSIATAIRKQIVAGVLLPGDQLPTRAELAARFDVAPSTIQFAIEDLRRSGFVETRVPAGTFVVVSPPHLHRFALVQPYDPGELGAGLWWESLMRSVDAFRANDRLRSFVVAEQIDGHEDRESYRQLVADLRQERLAGLIFTNAPYLLTHTPLIQMEGVPRVELATAQTHPEIPVVSQDAKIFYRRAIQHMVTRGRRRLALVMGHSENITSSPRHAFNMALDEAGLEIPAYWRLAVFPRQPETSRGVMHLLFKGTSEGRPDGVIILDDHLQEVTLDGIRDAGLCAPEDVEVLSIANFPAVRRASMPITRLGYDGRQILKQAIALIDLQRRGQKFPMITRIPPVFEHELAPWSSGVGGSVVRV